MLKKQAPTLERRRILKVLAVTAFTLFQNAKSGLVRARERFSSGRAGEVISQKRSTKKLTVDKSGQ
jgi:hypothetical protein